MNIADGIILSVIVIAALLGYKIGAVRFSTVYIKWCGSIAASVFGAPLVSSSLQSVVQVQELWLFIISFIALFLISFTLLAVACSWWMFHTQKKTHQHWLNKSSGVLIGAFTGVILTAVSYHFITASYWKEGKDELKASLLASMYIEYIGNHAETFVNNKLASAEGLQVAGVASSVERESFQTTSFSPDAMKALELLHLVNEERKLVGLQALQLDDELSTAAAFHGADMFVRGYFSHNTPEGKDPFQRLDSLKIAYKYAGENLAYSFSVVRAHIALMQSPGHRANILNPKFSKIGISVLDGGSKGLMVVQEFKN
jgi:uncharacterized protein YkwD